MKTDIYQTLLKAIREHSSMDDEQIVDAGNHGADAGWPGFTYTADCCEFYKANKEEIWELAQEMCDSMGNKNVAEMVAGFNRSDMLDMGPDGFENLLAWFALEEIGRWLADHPQTAEDEPEEDYEGTEGQDRESYSDTQDRENYTAS